ncbi:hypothetical protein [Corynebacterium rouxii]|uniref:Transposase n=1 Tax=Corynebacterium rouxii TaxID=2719119 RepID=A0ABU3PP29_9CORY|nr:hypothetical protein [Corynebacterium rouxii]MDT9409338.1 hypothetical protein [Corynebacterium rouxii]MDT9411571.1 hypothetical protein [Corynebacterium rouxii]
MIRFIDKHRNRISALFICQTLNTHREGGFLSLRGYRQSKGPDLSPAEVEAEFWEYHPSREIIKIKANA